MANYDISKASQLAKYGHYARFQSVHKRWPNMAN